MDFIYCNYRHFINYCLQHNSSVLSLLSKLSFSLIQTFDDSYVDEVKYSLHFKNASLLYFIRKVYNLRNCTFLRMKSSC